MARLGRREFHDGAGNRYLLELDFDDAAVMDGLLVARVKATRYDRETGRKTEAEAALTLDSENRLVRIEIQGLHPIEIRLPDDPAPFDDDERDLKDEAEMSDFLARMLEAGGAADRIGEIIDFIPAGEPGLGCVLKAGISTTLGQLVQCHFHHRNEPSVRRRAWRIVRCLGVHSPVMIAKAGLRTLRCWLTLGLA